MCLYCVLNATEDTESRAAKGSVSKELRLRIHGKAGCTVVLVIPTGCRGDKRTPGASPGALPNPHPRQSVG